MQWVNGSLIVDNHNTLAWLHTSLVMSYVEITLAVTYRSELKIGLPCSEWAVRAAGQWSQLVGKEGWSCKTESEFLSETKSEFSDNMHVHVVISTSVGVHRVPPEWVCQHNREPLTLIQANLTATVHRGLCCYSACWHRDAKFQVRQEVFENCSR